MASVTVVGVVGAPWLVAGLRPLGVTVVAAGGAGVLADVQRVRRRRVDAVLLGSEAARFAGVLRWVERSGLPFVVVSDGEDVGAVWGRLCAKADGVPPPPPPAPPVGLPPPAPPVGLPPPVG